MCRACSPRWVWTSSRLRLVAQFEKDTRHYGVHVMPMYRIRLALVFHFDNASYVFIISLSQPVWESFCDLQKIEDEEPHALLQLQQSTVFDCYQDLHVTLCTSA